MIQEIRKKVEEATGFDLSEKRRNRGLVYARAVYFKLCREKTNLTLQQIADSLGVNHATVLHCLNNIFPLLFEYEPDFSKVYNQIKKNSDITYLRMNYNALRKEYDKLLKKDYEREVQERKDTRDKTHDELFNIVKEIPNSQVGAAKIRIQAMVEIMKNYA